MDHRFLTLQPAGSAASSGYNQAGHEAAITPDAL
jgi:hypothetical protein